MISHTVFNAAASLARSKLPEMNGRIERAVELVQADMVWPPDRPGGSWLVQSQTDAAIFYAVNGSCHCPDAEHNAPLGLCKHRLAVWVAKKIATLRFCPACNGSGSHRTYESLRGVGLVPWERTCILCNGTGILDREQASQVSSEEPAWATLEA